MNRKVRKSDLNRWRYVGINKVIMVYLSFIWLPLFLDIFGLLGSGEFATFGIGLLGFGLYMAVDNKYDTSKIFQKYMESFSFTMGFMLFTLILTFIFVYRNYAPKKSAS